MEDALLLGSIVKMFDFSLPEGTTIEPTEGLTLLPGGGSLKLRIEKRARLSPRPAWTSEDNPISSRLRHNREAEEEG
jgi:hypothetical protein